MTTIDVFSVYKEYQAICSLLKSYNFQLKETENVIDITVSEDFDIELLKELGSVVHLFYLNCNPFPDDYDDIIAGLERGYKNISDITSISINFEKEYQINKIKNVQYIFFEKKSAIDFISTYSASEFADKINIGIMNSEGIETELFNFINVTNSSEFTEPPIKKISDETIKNIDFYLSNNRNNNHTNYFNPYSFVIMSSFLDSKSELSEMIKKEFYKSMLQSLSDKKEESSFIIRGEKNVAISFDDSFTVRNYKYFTDIFMFLISHQKYTEKFIITKKVITLYIHDEETLNDLDEKLPKVWKTINHYYNHYIEDNLKEFFKTKDQLLKEAMSVSKVIYEQTDKISNSITASIISTIILLITTLYRSLENLNIVFATCFIIIFFLFSSVYYHLMSDSTKKRYALTKEQFDHFISEISLIQGEEVEVIREKYLTNPYAELKKTLRKLLILLAAINLFLIQFYLIFICLKFNYCLC
ncbi:hypothetical protein [Pseudobacillus badius]|uniref:hypothetical protein n=1 Tax=Bacillus badius TaxID=1455 RepID=UPI0007B31D76|nr:hypothetical protein [Bacillus badius]KZR58350.1 hypothetical protein A3781_17275 [Bacillus badius]